MERIHRHWRKTVEREEREGGWRERARERGEGGREREGESVARERQK